MRGVAMVYSMSLGIWKMRQRFFYAQRFHGGCYGKADGAGPAVGVGHHEVLSEGVQASIDAFDACVEAFQVDAHIALCVLVGKHGLPLPSQRKQSLFAGFYTNICSIIQTWTIGRKMAK